LKEVPTELKVVGGSQMKKKSIVLLTIVVLALAIPVTVYAAGYYYCSTQISGTGGNGTFSFPWACSTTEQLNHVIYDVICSYGGGVLYQIYSDSYVYYQIAWVGNQCQITFQARYPGYPPNTGVEFPIPLVVGVAIGAAILLVVVGLVFRRRSMAS
jgi:hypothetical protein